MYSSKKKTFRVWIVVTTSISVPTPVDTKRQCCFSVCLEMASSVPFYAIDVAGLVLAVIGDNAKEAARLKTNPVVDPALPASVMRNDVLSPLLRPLVGTEKSIVERYLTKEAGPQNHDHAVPMLLALTRRMMIAPSRIPTIHGLGWGAFARHEIPAGTVLGL